MDSKGIPMGQKKKIRNEIKNPGKKGNQKKNKSYKLNSYNLSCDYDLSCIIKIKKLN